MQHEKPKANDGNDVNDVTLIQGYIYMVIVAMFNGFKFWIFAFYQFLLNNKPCFNL
jgi:hypothetical protein